VSAKSPGGAPPGGNRFRDLQSLRIQRPSADEGRPRRWPIVAAILLLAALGAAAIKLYGRTIGRPLQVRTAYAAMQRRGQPGVVLTGTGYVVTRHKYITIGTKVLGQIVEEPIEEGQHVKKGDLLARIDDRDYQAQLREAIAVREMAQADARLTAARANRYRQVDKRAISTDDL